MVTWFENGSLPKMYRLKTMMWRMSVVAWGQDFLFFLREVGGGGGEICQSSSPWCVLKRINLRSGDFFFTG